MVFKYALLDSLTQYNFGLLIITTIFDMKLQQQVFRPLPNCFFDYVKIKELEIK